MKAQLWIVLGVIVTLMACTSMPPAAREIQEPQPQPQFQWAPTLENYYVSPK
jgi:hypothetical protein